MTTHCVTLPWRAFPANLRQFLFDNYKLLPCEDEDFSLVVDFSLSSPSPGYDECPSDPGEITITDLTLFDREELVSMSEDLEKALIQTLDYGELYERLY